MKKKKGIILVVLSFFVLITACDKEETPATPSIPVVTTLPINSISFSTAISGGRITSKGGSSITYGACWSTSTNPTIGLSTKTIYEKGGDGFQGGVGFNDVLVQLKENTKYYIRAYATNSIGTAYGDQLSFTTTTAPPGCGNTSDIDGNIYPSVIIDSQCWMRENLNTTKYRNGDIIPQVQDTSKWRKLMTGAWCYYENYDGYLNKKDGTLNKKYGKLYNWYAVNDSRGLAPEGWHVPSSTEFLNLSYFIASRSSFGIAGPYMRVTTSWYSSEPTNGSGFTALPAGGRESSGVFSGGNLEAKWWTTTLQNTGSNEAKVFEVRWTAFETFSYSKYKTAGLSVRCIKGPRIINPL
jgi:uncharacterized protein (TIGR02145 family)